MVKIKKQAEDADGSVNALGAVPTGPISRRPKVKKKRRASRLVDPVSPPRD